MPETGLTHDQKMAILKQVILRIDAPAGEHPEAAAWRRQCENDVAKDRAAGIMTELPRD